ncbi:acetolactate synthase 2 catalytic subunit [Echinimonas agarilytica]|uniref:Acetolactate synthase n=1 Tax=Echinimonas agarilytica TaxID=1215918 RepID=A0AA42B639_9GAMM|nr:acetolactate synthase 2 catalytic subunit [Echinimonas agarilytica]MCM2678204.1 acetolactate synthase 2 catalytic subunit [Echinimonas agarilytica]
MTGADLVVQTLSRMGVETIFGYPGGAIMPVYDAIHRGDVEHILCRNEQGAALAAVGFARACNDVGVCLATSGPGATNLITGLADAMLDSVPVVAITGQVARPLMGTDAFQEVDILGLSLAVTKHSFLVEDAGELQSILEEAFELARSGRPGPVLVDIPKDIQIAALLPGPLSELSEPTDKIDASSIAAAAEMIQTAKKPILYIGGGVGMGGAVDSLRALAEHSGIPSVTTLKGIGAIEDEWQYHLGMLGMHGTKAANLMVQESDLLIVAGARFDDRVTGKLDEFAPHASVVHFDIDPCELGKLRHAHVGLLGDLDDGLQRLCAQLNTPPDIAPWQQRCVEHKATHAWRYDKPGESIFAPKLLHQLSQVLPHDSVVACDVGQHQMWVAQHMSFAQPNDHLSSGGLGTMGFGLPAAIGAQYSRKDAVVVNVTGDGSFMMNVQELGTIRRYGLPVKILLLDNERLGMVRQWQELFFDGRYSETILSDNPDFVALANAFGITSRTITRDDEIQQGINDLVNSEGSYLLHVRIDAEENVWPLVPPGAANQQMMETAE